MAKLKAAVTDFDNDYSVGYDRATYDKRADDFSAYCKANTVIRFQIADGYATYLVESVSPPVLRHIRFGDNYQAHDATIRGLRAVDIQDMLDREARMAALFNRE